MLDLSLDSAKTERLARAFYDVLKPTEEMTVAEWAEKNRVLDAKAGSALAGRFSLDQTPYLREPLECLTDGTIETIVLMWAAQTAKTDGMIFNAILYAVDCDPGNMLFVLPDQRTIKKFVRGRFKPTLDANPAALRHLPDRKKAITLEEIEFDRCHLFFGLAGSVASQAAMPCRYVFIDETDSVAKAVKNSIDFVGNSMERTKTFWNRKHVITSIPDEENGVIDTLYKEGDQRIFEVPCLRPGCDHVGEYDFRQLKTETERPRTVDYKEWANLIDMGKVPVFYECPECGEKHYERHKAVMNRMGVWRKTGEPGPTASFQLSSMASQLYQWKSMLSSWFRSQGSRKKIKTFTNQKLAKPWKESRKRADKDEVMKRLSPLGRGVVPEWAQLLTLGADVQDWGIPWSVWGYGPELRMQMVDHGIANSLDELNTLVMKRPYRRGTGDGGRVTGKVGEVFHVMGGCVDSRHRTMEVNTWCATHPGARVVPIMGTMSQARKRERLTESETQFVPEIGGSVPLLLLDVNQYKDLLFQVFERPAEHELAMKFHQETDFRFSSEFTAEERVQVRNAKGYQQWVWQVKAGQEGNHFLDTSVYAMAAADYMGLMALSEAGNGESGMGDGERAGNGDGGMGNGGGGGGGRDMRPGSW